jgi:hypothetical protein
VRELPKNTVILTVYQLMEPRSSVADPDPHQTQSDKLDPDSEPHQFSYDKPKWMEYKPI